MLVVREYSTEVAPVSARGALSPKRRLDPESEQIRPDVHEKFRHLVARDREGGPRAGHGAAKVWFYRWLA